MGFAGILKFTGWREPISISGAGKVVDGILRQRPCFLSWPSCPSRPNSRSAAAADALHFPVDPLVLLVDGRITCSIGAGDVDTAGGSASGAGRHPRRINGRTGRLRGTQAVGPGCRRLPSRRPGDPAGIARGRRARGARGTRPEGDLDRAGACGRAASAAAASGSAAPAMGTDGLTSTGKRSKNVVPSPTRLSISTVPEWRWTMP